LLFLICIHSFLIRLKIPTTAATVIEFKMPTSTSRIIVFQFLALSHELFSYYCGGQEIRYNSTVVGISNRLQRRLERLIWKHRLGFIRLFHVTDLIYFHQLYVKNKLQKGKIHFIIICNDYPYRCKIFLDCKLQNFKKIHVRYAIFINYNYTTSIAIANAVSLFLGRSSYNFSHSLLFFRYPPPVLTFAYPCARFQFFDDVVNFDLFCTI